MKTYQSTKQTEDSNRIVKELNARVLSLTFKNKEGLQMADLYSYNNTGCKNPLEIVAHNTCAPALGVFVETILISFN